MPGRIPTRRISAGSGRAERVGGWRIPLLVLALIASAPAWGQAPETSPRPRARPAPTLSISEAAVAEALAAPPGTAARPRARPAGALTISEAAAAEAAAAEAAAAAAREIARVAAQEAERQAAAQAAAAAVPPAPLAAPLALGDNPLAVARSPVPRRRDPELAAAALARAQTRATEVRGSDARAAAEPLAPRAAGPVRGNLCGVRGLEGRELPRITSSTQGCGIAAPVSLTAVQGIPLSLAATIDCDTARAFDRWVRGEMLPAVGRTGGGVVQIRVVGHYSCRPRNNQRGARISEHGRGRAIDVAGYRLANGDVVTVEQHYRRGAHSRSMRRMYQAACGIFRTTLGPDADRFHQDHFHFDLAQHRNGGTYCR